MKIGSLEETAEEPTSHKEGVTKRVMLRNREVPHITQFAQARIHAGERIESHRHPDMYEVFLVEEGTGYVKINLVNYPLKKGSYFVIKPGEDHEFSSDSELTLTYFGVKVNKQS